MSTELVEVFNYEPHQLQIYWDINQQEYYNRSTDIYLCDDDLKFYKLPKIGEECTIFLHSKGYSVTLTADIITLIHKITWKQRKIDIELLISLIKGRSSRKGLISTQSTFNLTEYLT